MNRTWKPGPTVLMAVVFLGCLLFQFAIVVPALHRHEIAREQSLQTEVAGYIAAQVEADVGQHASKLLGVAGRAEFAAMDVAGMQQTLDTLTQGSPRLLNATVLDAEGMPLVTSGMKECAPSSAQNARDEPCVTVPLEQGQVFCAEPRFCSSSGLLLTDFCIPVQSPTGDRLAVLMGTLGLNRLVDMVASSEVREGMVVSLLDNEGRLMADSSVDVFALPDGPLTVHYNWLPAIEASEPGAFTEIAEREMEGVAFYVSHRVIEPTGWVVTVSRPRGAVLAEVREFSDQLLVGNLALFFVAVTIALTLERRLTAVERGAARSLAESERKYRLLFEGSSDAMSLADASGHFTNTNGAWVDLLGYSESEAASMRAADVCADPEEHERLMRLLLANSSVKDFELRLRRFDGTIIDALVSVRLRRTKDSVPLVYETVARDITEHKRGQAALQEREEKYRSLFEQSLDAIYISTPSGKVADANAAFLHLYGYTKEELSRVAAADLYANPPDREHFLRQVTGKGTIDEEAVFKRKDGTTFVGQRTATVRRDRDGKVAAFQGIVRDITQQQLAEQQLRESHAQTEAVLRGTVAAIQQMAEVRDPYTAGHERRVTELSEAIARRMGLEEERIVSVVRVAGQIHDIGKISVPGEILSKPGRLNAAEFQLIRNHPQVGHDIVTRAGFPSVVAEVVLQHHEKMDGSGYPQGLVGDAILLEARILTVSDVVEAMSSYRPYRPALGIEAALEEIRGGSGRKYCPKVAAACLEAFENGFSFSM
jgi:PAS domain S-box-containing protein/putative nucleotidyltransferase with HDIG domain